MKEMKTLTIGDVQYVIVDGSVGSLKALSTTNKSSIVAAINELVSSKGSINEEDLNAAINAALEEAKKNGEFDGPKGDTGVGILNVVQSATSTADDGNNVITVTLTDGNTFTFTVQNGSKGSSGTNGKDGASITVKSVSESTVDGGNNVITFSDGKTITIRNGATGSQGPAGKDASVTATSIRNALGYSPLNPNGLSFGYHTDGLIYIFVDGTPVGTGIELSAGGISGYVDSENNIIINGLPDGTYTIKYEMADGSTIDIGALEVGEAEPEAKNYFDVAAQLNYRLGSSGSPSSYNGMVVTDYIPWNEEMSGKNFVVSEVTQVLSGAYGYYSRTVYYDENKTKVAEYNDTGDLDAYIPSVLGAYAGGGFVRISLVLKDNVALTAADVANLKITLE